VKIPTKVWFKKCVSFCSATASAAAKENSFWLPFAENDPEGPARCVIARGGGGGGVTWR
jgi:hypothetical protein